MAPTHSRLDFNTSNAMFPRLQDPFLKEFAIMKMPELFYTVWAPRVLGAMRMVIGFLFLQHGTAKLFAIPHIAMFDGVTLFSLLGLAGVLELVGGLLILLGLFTRLAAFILSGEMAVAYFMAHAPQGFLPILNQGELAVLYCFAFLYLAVAGAGDFSLDSVCCKTCRDRETGNDLGNP
jgi:putative oxidoreductase